MIELVIGNKNYSSWSLRPWLLLKHFHIEFNETRVLLNQPDTKQRIGSYGAAGRVPILVINELVVWDSLAICEAVRDLFAPSAWPKAPERRAQARSYAAEMHSGFSALRRELPMNVRARRRVPMSREAAADVARIDELWSSARRASSGGGPWLFGEFSIADAMFAPVASRFCTYNVAVSPPSSEYMQTVLDHPAMREWAAAATVERETIAADEVGEDR